MKKFNLAAFGFALYTIFNNGTIFATTKAIKEGEADTETEVKPNGKGLVQLTASAAGSIGKKAFAAGEVVAVKLADVMTWPEAADWVEVPLTDAQKTELRTKRKELAANLETSTKEMLAAFGKPNFTELAAKVNDANIALEKFDEANPALKAKKAASDKPAKEYTPEEKVLIEAYEKHVKELREAEELVKKTKELVKTAKEALPEGYSTKGSGLKAPTVTDQIRSAMFYDYTVGKMTMPKIAEKYGYSSSYCTLLVKGSKTYTKGLEDTQKAYATIGEAAAKEFAAKYVVVLS